MEPGNALLLHGTLRPAHLVSRPWYRRLRWRRAAKRAWHETAPQRQATAANAGEAA
jgi:hypothetical protein